MRFEWDEKKNRHNQRKHGGVSFDLAVCIFKDERCIMELDSVDDSGEQRWYALGSYPAESNLRAVLFVVYVYREDNHGEEFVRVISARKAGKHERRRYHEQTLK